MTNSEKYINYIKNNELYLLYDNKYFKLKCFLYAFI